MTKTIEEARRTYPGLIDDPDGITTVSYGHYLPGKHISTYGVFRICADSANSYRAIVCFSDWKDFKQDDPATFGLVGAGDCFHDKVITPSGRRVLGEQFLKDFDLFASHHRQISEISNREALAVAVDIISSTARFGDAGRDSDCVVGGPTRAVLLDEKHSKPFTLQ